MNCWHSHLAFLQCQGQEKSCTGGPTVTDPGRHLFCTVSNAAFKGSTGISAFYWSVWFSLLPLNLKASVLCEERVLVCERTPCYRRQIATQHPTTNHGAGPLWGSECSGGYTPDPLSAAIPQCDSRTYSHTNILFMFYHTSVPHTLISCHVRQRNWIQGEIQTRAWLISGVFGHLIWISLPWHVSMCWYTTPVTFLSLGPLASFKNFLLFWTVKSWDYIDFTALLSKVITAGNSMFWCSGCILLLFAERFDFPIKKCKTNLT